MNTFMKYLYLHLNSQYFFEFVFIFLEISGIHIRI